MALELRMTSKQARFFELLPLLEELHDLALALLAFVGVRSGEIKAKGLTLQSAFKMTFSRGNESLSIEQVLNRLESICELPLIESLRSHEIKSIGSLATHALEIPDEQHAKLFYKSLQRHTCHIDTLIDELAKRTFGIWGAHFFRVALEHEPTIPVIFPRTAKRRLLTSPAEPLLEQELIQAAGLASHDVVLSDGNRVRIPDREPCQLRAKEFSMLKVLLNHSGKFISFERIASEMGGDQYDVASLAATKSRLTKNLRDAGYLDLADCLRSRTGAYGIFV